MTDRQIAPSRPFKQSLSESSQDGSTSNSGTKNSLFTPDQVELYKKRYEEGYNLDDPNCTAWLKINHPTEVCSNTVQSSSSLVSCKQSEESKDSGKPGNMKLSCDDALSEILVLPCPEPRNNSKHKVAINAKAICITDGTILEDLKRKQVEKAGAKKEKEAKRIERECNKKLKQLERERKKAVREKNQLKKSVL